MVVVKIELWPFGSPDNKRELGRMYIANIGGDRERGDYQVAVCRKGTTEVPDPILPGGRKPTRQGQVTNYPRISLPVWSLISRALKVCFPEENK